MDQATRHGSGVTAMNRLLTAFKGLGDENRLRIINLLFHGELCGCDIQHVMEGKQSNISRHLMYLKNAGLVKDRRAGYRVFYRLASADRAEMRGLFEYLRGAFGTDPQMRADRRKLREAIRGGACTVSEWKPYSGIAGTRVSADLP